MSGTDALEDEGKLDGGSCHLTKSFVARCFDSTRQKSLPNNFFFLVFRETISDVKLTDFPKYWQFYPIFFLMWYIKQKPAYIDTGFGPKAIWNV